MIHAFSVFLRIVIILLIIVMAAAIILFGSNPWALGIVAIIAALIAGLVLIYRFYLRDPTVAMQVFDLIPCRLTKVERNRFRHFCSRCKSTYASLAVMVGILAFAESANVKLLDTVYHNVFPALGLYPYLSIAIIFVLSIPIQAVIFAKKRRQSDSLRAITGFFFAVGVVMLGIYALNAYAEYNASLIQSQLTTTNTPLAEVQQNVTT